MRIEQGKMTKFYPASAGVYLVSPNYIIFLCRSDCKKVKSLYLTSIVLSATC